MGAVVDFADANEKGDEYQGGGGILGEEGV